MTYHGEVHDLEDPDGEGQIDDHGDEEEEDEEVEAALPPAVDAHRVRLRTAWPLQGIGLRCQDVLLLGHLRGGETRQAERRRRGGWKREKDRQKESEREEGKDRNPLLMYSTVSI